MLFHALLVLEPEAVNLAHVAGGDERLDLLLPDEFHQLGELILGQQSFQFDGFLVGVAADDLVLGPSKDQRTYSLLF